jgi:putative SOS response-associated peptidase YedK
MCGRFTLTVDPAKLMGVFEDFSFPAQFAPRYNISPGQPVLAVPNDDKNKVDFFHWGLIPSWTKDPAISKKLINARSETIAEKPSFRGSFKYKRCLIPADGFYEWKVQSEKKTKTPFFIHMKDRQPFAFAGLWDEWLSPDGNSIRTCTIITTTPNELMSDLHNRMPVILDQQDFGIWLNPIPQSSENLNHLFKPFPADRMSAYPVSTRVNTPVTDLPDLIFPLEK